MSSSRLKVCASQGKIIFCPPRSESKEQPYDAYSKVYLRRIYCYFTVTDIYGLIISILVWSLVTFFTVCPELGLTFREPDFQLSFPDVWQF